MRSPKKKTTASTADEPVLEEQVADARGALLAHEPRIDILVLHPVTRESRRGPASDRNASSDERTNEEKLQEAIGLAAAIDLRVDRAMVVNVPSPKPATLFGQGQVEQIKKLLETGGAGAGPRPRLVIVNHALSPVQQRNLERDWQIKVIDRTGLILEIFGARARTKEGQLQVELAALSYQKSRLVRSWTHLERQRGGFGFLGGPGESQLEMDRRLIGERILRLKRDLSDVRRMRGLQRARRERSATPVVALIGYTNAGKSTLFNRLSGADVLAKDLLFATLDPAMRAVELKNGRKFILSDTVGFIADLPTHLIEAFRATLEEVELADVILHVRDISHPETEAQRTDALNVLASLGIEADDHRIIEVCNKIDRLTPTLRDRWVTINRRALNAARESRVRRRQSAATTTIGLSAALGMGIGDLLAIIEARAFENREVTVLSIPYAQGAALAWLHTHSDIIEQKSHANGYKVTVAIEESDLARYHKLFTK